MFDALISDYPYSGICVTGSVLTTQPDYSEIGKFSFARDTAAYVATPNDQIGPVSFLPSDKTSENGSVALYRKGSSQSLRLFTGGFAKYSRVVRFLDGSANAMWCASGIPTLQGDTPTDARITYKRFVVEGTAYKVEAGTVGVYNVSGTVSVEIDFATAKVKIIYTISGTNASGTIDLGTHEVSADLDRFGQFSTTVSDKDVGLGELEGQLFGPLADEVGFTTYPLADGNKLSYVLNVIGAR